MAAVFFVYSPGVTRWIRTPGELTDLARSLEECRAVGLDTESDSLYHHVEKVCLLQLATDRGTRASSTRWPSATSRRSPPPWHPPRW